MYEDGFTTIQNIDISKVVVEQMVEKYKDKEGLKWTEMNVTDMQFSENTFDVVIDKGCMDSILCGEGSTNNVGKMCSEVSRVLKEKGIYIVVTYGIPENRLSYLEKDDYRWKVTTQTVPKPTISTTAQSDNKEASAVHYIYICQKGGAAEE